MVERKQGFPTGDRRLGEKRVWLTTHAHRCYLGVNDNDPDDDEDDDDDTRNYYLNLILDLLLTCLCAWRLNNQFKDEDADQCLLVCKYKEEVGNQLQVQRGGARPPLMTELNHLKCNWFTVMTKAWQLMFCPYLSFRQFI